MRHQLRRPCLEHAGFLRLGVGLAAKAGWKKKDVINTLRWLPLRKELQRKRKGAS